MLVPTGDGLYRVTQSATSFGLATTISFKASAWILQLARSCRFAVASALSRSCTRRRLRWRAKAQCNCLTTRLETRGALQCGSNQPSNMLRPMARTLPRLIPYALGCMFALMEAMGGCPNLRTFRELAFPKSPALTERFFA